ncbi:hypothetical protein CsSME_00007640 [Camellia sinensis var. sinensis]
MCWKWRRKAKEKLGKSEELKRHSRNCVETHQIESFGVLLVMSPDCSFINSHDIYNRLTNQSKATISPFLKVPVSVMTLKTHIFH